MELTRPPSIAAEHGVRAWNCSLVRPLCVKCRSLSLRPPFSSSLRSLICSPREPCLIPGAWLSPLVHSKQAGSTPAEFAREAGEDELADFLEKAGASLWTLAQNQHWKDCLDILARGSGVVVDIDETSSVSGLRCPTALPDRHRASP
eukprot:scaffold10794_cov119-Isochrysis_galbana.AAC.7